MSPRNRRLLPVVVAALIVSPVWPATAVAADPPDDTRSAKAHTITLITGDRVQLSTMPDGTHETIFMPAQGREGIGYVQHGDSERVLVIPKDAELPLAQGKLDPRLFDVTGLAEQQVGDQLPLIISRVNGRADLPSINASVSTVDSNGAQALWRSLPDVEKIWLNGLRTLLDDVSNPQIGVPVAWEAGYRGKGVTIGLLDTGIDETHPDLAGVIVGTKDFTNTGVKDTHGHGTHVASIIAGSGAASGGKYAGVAPEAKVLAGKVCTDTGCRESSIIAGMEWASAQGADVVNMSLGGPDTAGVDPLEAAVNRLTGTLFVVAAGNSGPNAQTVSSPSTADAALSVASVSSSDTVSRFSSRGPRIGDAAVKPEIAAPGEAIAAARAAGTSMGSPIDDSYTRASGTSMATPHVAGAAALLAQARPGLSPAQLKDALTSTAKQVNGSVADQGVGRVDLARAITQPVYATPTVTFGRLKWPSPSAPAQTKDVLFTNNGDTDVTLDLAQSSSGPSAAEGLFSLSTNKVVVPAHGGAKVGLTVHPAVVPTTAFGTYTGLLIASDGKNVTQTAFTVATEDESYDVNVELIDRAGNAPATEQVVYLTKLHTLPTPSDPGHFEPHVIRGGEGTIRLPKGEYVFNAGITDGTTSTVVIEPLVRNDRDISLTFDARRGKPAGFGVQRAGAVPYYNILFAQHVAQNSSGARVTKELLRAVTNDNTFVVPVESDPARFSFGIQGLLGSSWQNPPAEPFVYNLAWGEAGRIGDQLMRRYTDRELARFVSRYRALGVTDTVAERAVMPNYLPGQSLRIGPYVTVPLPTRKRVEYYNTAPGLTWKQVMTPHHTSVPVSNWGRMDGNPETYRRGTTTHKDWNTAALSTQIDIHDSAQGIWRDGNRIYGNLSVFTPNDAGLGSLFLLSGGDGTNTLSRDGQVIRSLPFPDLGNFTVPADEGRYTLTSSATRNVAYSSLSTKVNASWTFTSAPTTERTFLSVPTVRVSGEFDDYNRAGAGTFGLRIIAKTQAEAPASAITAVSLETSSDDGVTWTAARVCTRASGDVWNAVVSHPNQAGGFISVRVKATAANGNTVEQTIIRAYGLR